MNFLEPEIIIFFGDSAWHCLIVRDTSLDHVYLGPQVKTVVGNENARESLSGRPLSAHALRRV